MRKRNIIGCCLLALMIACSGVASANAPYASIMAFTQNMYNNAGDAPILNIMAKLNIINLTPWEIFIGNPGDPGIMQGFAGPAVTTTTQQPMNKPKSPPPNAMPLLPFWMKGINGVDDSSSQGKRATGADGFAFHSLQIGLNNPNNAWLQPDVKLANNTTNPQYNTAAVNITGEAQAPGQNQGPYAAYTTYLTVPIVINSSNGSQAGNSVSLNFMVTSSQAFAILSSKDHYVPAPALSYGDGQGNNYAWATQATGTSEVNSPQSNTTFNVSQFLTIQGNGTGANNWFPVPTTNGGLYTPSYLNSAALGYPNFASLSGVHAVPKQEYDLIVYLQSGDYADLSLIFIAVPSTATTALRK